MHLGNNSVMECKPPWKLKGGSRLLLTYMLTLQGGGLFDGHAWSWVIVPLDLVKLTWCDLHTFLMPPVLWHNNLKCMPDLSPRRERQHTLTPFTKFLGGLSSKDNDKNPEINNSPPYVTATWPPQQLPPLNFLAIHTEKKCLLNPETKHFVTAKKYER